MLDKSWGLSVDCVAYDLEDSVTIDKKPDARRNISGLLKQDRVSGIGNCAVRINSIGSGLEKDDLDAVVSVVLDVFGSCSVIDRDVVPITKI